MSVARKCSSWCEAFLLCRRHLSWYHSSRQWRRLDQRMYCSGRHRCKGTKNCIESKPNWLFHSRKESWWILHGLWSWQAIWSQRTRTHFWRVNLTRLSIQEEQGWSTNLLHWQQSESKVNHLQASERYFQICVSIRFRQSKQCWWLCEGHPSERWRS